MIDVQDENFPELFNQEFHMTDHPRTIVSTIGNGILNELTRL